MFVLLAFFPWLLIVTITKREALSCLTVVLPCFDCHVKKKTVLYFIFDTCNCLSRGVYVVFSLAWMFHSSAIMETVQSVLLISAFKTTEIKFPMNRGILYVCFSTQLLFVGSVFLREAQMWWLISILLLFSCCAASAPTEETGWQRWEMWGNWKS